MNSKVTSFAKRHAAGIIIALLITAVIGGGGILWLSWRKPEPQNLGPQLEYVGKDNLGCMLWWCEVKPYSVYYYATDMSADSLKGYFSEAQFASEPDGGGSFSTDYTSKGIQFKLNDTDSMFLIQYYDNTQTVIRLFHLKPTTKSHTISITDSDYQLALKALAL
jgi:hypothetical protein